MRINKHIFCGGVPAVHNRSRDGEQASFIEGISVLVLFFLTVPSLRQGFFGYEDIFGVFF